MEDKLTLEYFLSLLDEGERVIDGDFFSEKHRIVDYELQKKVVDVPVDSVSSCRNCSLWRNRIKYAAPIINRDCALMCIILSPEGLDLLSAESCDYFGKWMKAIGLGMENVSLTSLLKCPSQGFDKDNADMCKSYLREELSEAKPKCLLLLGEDISRYMLRKNLPLDALRGRRYLINNIPAFVTYSPHDLVQDRALRVPIWEDLKLLEEAL